jgi:two-component system nitrogen regulation response regulator GlnG
MQRLYKVVAQVMHSDLAVMICGESGTGKSLLAHAIHDYSDRRTLPLVTVTAPDLHESDGPSQVMARVRGGTLVLDEVSDLPPEVQGRVVRMMDAPGDHAPRFMATSRMPPAIALEEGRLREERGDDRGAALARPGRGYRPSGRAFPDPRPAPRHVRAAFFERCTGDDARL